MKAALSLLLFLMFVLTFSALILDRLRLHAGAGNPFALTPSRLTCMAIAHVFNIHETTHAIEALRIASTISIDHTGTVTRPARLRFAIDKVRVPIIDGTELN